MRVPPLQVQRKLLFNSSQLISIQFTTNLLKFQTEIYVKIKTTRSYVKKVSKEYHIVKTQIH
jgi:hypothetical protein